MGDFRRNRQSFVTSEGRMKTSRTGWIKIHNMDLIRYDEEEKISLSIRPHWLRSPVVWSLQSMTGAEVRAVRKFFMDAFDQAEKIADRLDKEAQDALDNGDDSFERVYRAAPYVVDRSGGKSTHGKVLPKRPDAVPVEQPDSRGDGDSIPGAGDAGDELAEHGAPDVEAKDDPEA